MPLHNFMAGESANVAENLDNNFQFLLNLIQSGLVGTQTAGNAVGSSTAVGFARANFASTGTAFGLSSANGIAFSNALVLANATATGGAVVSAAGSSQNAGVASAVGVATVAGFSSTPSVGSATSAATVSGVGSASARAVGTAIGDDGPTVAVSNYRAASIGTITGSSTASAVGQGSAIESPDGTTVTNPSQVIFASNSPGVGSTTNLNTFSLSAQPGQLMFNGVADSTTSNVVELYYSGHFLYYENAAGSWNRWAFPGTYVVVANPTPVTIVESPEGTILTTTAQTIYASSTPGTAAPAGATVGNGLVTWQITANPGQIIRGGVIDQPTANVTQVYYHNHYAYHINVSQDWYQYTGSGPNSGYSDPVASPYPTTPTLNIARIVNQNTNTTFYVNGTYQAYSGTGTPSLQYQDNQTGSWLAFPSSVNVTATSWSFVHPPIASVSGAYTVGVRDANQTGTIALSNTFQVSTPGVVTLLGVTLSNNSFVAGQPAGTVVGVVAVQATGGTFTGTISVTGTNASSFTVNGSSQLVTTAVLGTGSYSITLNALMSGGSRFAADLASDGYRQRGIRSGHKRNNRRSDHRWVEHERGCWIAVGLVAGHGHHIGPHELRNLPQWGASDAHQRGQPTLLHQSHAVSAIHLGVDCQLGVL
jgi:hypothetical protein